MSTYFAVIGTQRTAIKLDSTPIGSGGEADIHRVTSMQGCAAKLYHSRMGATHASREKLEAMLKRPPEHLTARANGQKLSLFAWPTHIIEDGSGNCTGFLMEEIPLGKAAKLSKYVSREMMRAALSQDDCSLPRRIQVCRNLAAVVAELHRQKHFCVDIKPQNIYMFKDTGIVCVLDNDSFSIAPVGDGPRFPSSAFTSEYLAPELLRNGMSPESVVNDTQDRFALAVIMFQVLNFGIHPFQGVPRIHSDEWNIDLCVTRGYYAYGASPNNAIDPAPSSVHDCWDLATRSLFERAFTGAPSQRPAAEEWRNHFDHLQQMKAFSRCSLAPTDVLHVHFSGQPCPECRLAALDAAAAAGQASVPVPAADPDPVSIPSQSAPSAAFKPPAATGSKTWLNWVVAAAVAWVVWSFISGGRQKEDPLPAPAPAAAPTSQAPPATPAWPPVAAPAQQPASMAAAAPTPSAEVPVASAEEAARDASARHLSDASDTPGINARIGVISAVIGQAKAENQASMLLVIEQAHLGDDAATLDLARTAMRNGSFLQKYAGWQRMRKDARPINEEVRNNYRDDSAMAIVRQSRAVALDPQDREAVGNLAFYLGLAGKSDDAMTVAIYGLSLPRSPQETGRGADWQMVGSMFARMGRVHESAGAYFVGLAITPNLSGFCRSLLAQQADFGDALKQPIDIVFKRIFDRGQSSVENCAYPPQWRM